MTQIQNSAHKMKMSPVPFVGDILPEPGAMVVSEHDGHIYYADKYGWHKADAVYSLITMFFRFDGTTQLGFNIYLPTGSTLTMDWGDGTTTDYAGNTGAQIPVASSYTVEGNYSVILRGDYLELTDINILDHDVSFSIHQLTQLTKLDFLGITNVDAYGDISSFADYATTGLFILNVPGIYGEVSKLKTGASIQVALCPKTTMEEATIWDGTAADFYDFYGNGWSASEVDNVFKSITNLTDGRVVLWGNENFTADVLTEFNALLTAGNSILVSDHKPIVDLGPELFTVPCAVSDNAGNEEPSIDGWTNELLNGTGKNSFVASYGVAQIGQVGFAANPNPQPSTNAKFYLTDNITVVATEVYRTSFYFWWLEGTGRWSLYHYDGLSFNILPYNIKPELISIYSAAPSTDLSLECRCRPPGAGAVGFDALSVRQVI